MYVGSRVDGMKHLQLQRETPMRKMVLITSVLIFLGQPTAFAQTTQQQLEALTIEIDLLKRLIIDQDQRIKVLEKQIKGGASGVSDSTGTGFATGSPKGWKISANWNRIKRGMASQQVIDILGQPTRREVVGSYLDLFYEGRVSGSGYLSGNVMLQHNRVWKVNIPVF